MKIAIACDQGGFAVKETIKLFLDKLQHPALDLGCYSEESVDYPDFGQRAIEAVLTNETDRAILICGTGIGMSILANSYPGIRAALAYNEEVARLSREHNDANVLCLGGRQFSKEQLLKIIKIWLNTEFSKEERHIRRLQKIEKIRNKRD